MKRQTRFPGQALFGGLQNHSRQPSDGDGQHGNQRGNLRNFTEPLPIFYPHGKFMSRKPHHYRQHVCPALLTILMLTWLPIPHASGQTPELTTTSTSKADTADKPPTATSPPPAATTADPNVSLAHLNLFVKPLTVKELEIEAKEWQNLLKRNVQTITSIHIRIEQLTTQIAQFKETGSPKEIKPTADESTSGSQANSTQNKPKPPTGPVNSQTEQPTPANTTSSATDIAATDTSTTTPDSSQTNPATIASLTSEKERLSEQLTELTLQKTDISQRFDVVLNSLELKGGDATPYRKYNNALNGVALEVTGVSGMWRMFTSWVIAEQGGKRWAWNILKFIVILLISYFGASILAKFVRRGSSRVKGVSQLLVDFLSSFTKQIAMIIGFIVGLAALEIDITPLIAAVGAAGFVVAFALQGTLSNFASGLLILAYRPFDVGDVIEAAGIAGTVDSVSLFSTHVRTFDNKLMIAPNNDIWGGTITNATASKTRRVDLVFAIGYADDINHAQSILTQVVNNHPLILKDPAPNIRVNELADSSVNLICRPWTSTENYWTVYWDLMHSVKQEFDRAGVSIPFPQRDVHVYGQNTDQ